MSSHIESARQSQPRITQPAEIAESETPAPGWEIPGADVSAEAAQWVAFSLDGQNFCVDIMAVREIRAWTGATPLPNTAYYVRGVINLRGSIVPIIDLKKRFGQGDTEPTGTHAILIVSNDEQLVGLLVDAVSDIITAGEDAVAPVPEMEGSDRSRFLAGLITHDERMVAVVDLEQIVGE